MYTMYICYHGRKAGLSELKRVCENCAVPEGTRTNFPLYPALRLRLRAGLNYAASTALEFQLLNSAGKCEVRSQVVSEALGRDNSTDRSEERKATVLNADA